VVWQDCERFSAAFADEEVRIYRNETALPRAYLVPLAVTLPQSEHVKQMAERAFDPERMVLIETPVTPPAAPTEGIGTGSWYQAPNEPFEARPAIVQTLDPTGRGSQSPAGSVTIASYAGTRIDLSVRATQPAWLFLGDTYDPAWRAYVDGQPTPIHLANAMFRAVPILTGSHTVTFRYESLTLGRGATLSLATGFATLLIALIGIAKRLRPR